MPRSRKSHIDPKDSAGRRTRVSAYLPRLQATEPAVDRQPSRIGHTRYRIRNGIHFGDLQSKNEALSTF